MHRIEAYFRLAIIFIVVICILYLPILLKLEKKGISVFRQFGYLGLFCTIFIIIFATILFVPITFQPEQHILNLIPFNWVNEQESTQQFLVEVIPNIIIFIPLGLFIPIVFINKRKLYRTAIIVFILTFCIESFQYFIGRSCDINDIIANLSGGIIGYLIFKILNQVAKKRNCWNKLIGNKI